MSIIRISQKEYDSLVYHILDESLDTGYPILDEDDAREEIAGLYGYPDGGCIRTRDLRMRQEDYELYVRGKTVAWWFADFKKAQRGKAKSRSEARKASEQGPEGA